MPEQSILPCGQSASPLPKSPAQLPKSLLRLPGSVQRADESVSRLPGRGFVTPSSVRALPQPAARLPQSVCTLERSVCALEVLPGSPTEQAFKANEFAGAWAALVIAIDGKPEGARTPDLQIRSQPRVLCKTANLRNRLDRAVSVDPVVGMADQRTRLNPFCQVSNAG